MSELPSELFPDQGLEIQWGDLAYEQTRHILKDGEIIERVYGDGAVGIRYVDGTAITVFPEDTGLADCFEHPWPKEDEHST